MAAGFSPITPPLCPAPPAPTQPNASTPPASSPDGNGTPHAGGPGPIHRSREAEASQLQGLFILQTVRPLHRHLSLTSHPTKRVSSPVHAAALGSAISSCVPSPSHLVLSGTLLWAHETLSLSFLVDSGANESFMDESLAKQARIPIEAKQAKSPSRKFPNLGLS